MKKPYDNNQPFHIVLAGGGSGGPVMPLFAIAQTLQAQVPSDFLLIGTNGGPERIMAEWNKISFQTISAGKFRRYFSFKTILAPFQSLLGFFQARRILKKFNARVFVAAGGFVSVPAGYAAWSLGIPVLIHQQDIVPSVSNKLLAPIATAITVTFEKSLKDFNAQSGLGLSGSDHRERCIWSGNPVRPEIANVAMQAQRDHAYGKTLREKFNIFSDWPVLLILGGGTGATGLNQIIHDALPQLLQRFEIIHASGNGKGFQYEDAHYHQFELIENIAEAYAIADMVICRAGVGTITELAAAKKVAIVVPMPNSHQEENALYLHDRGAAMIYAQELLTADRLASIASGLLYDAAIKSELAEQIAQIMPLHAAETVSSIILELCQTKN